MIEEEVREELGRLLRPYSESIMAALTAIGRLDLLLAKASLALSLGLSRPRLTSGATAYKGLVYLPVERMLNERGKEFQSVDISLRRGVTLITGANMGGKTVTLKSVALAQAMVQFGMYAPARRAEVNPVASIEVSMGDAQSEAEGLSSFGAEIVRLDSIIRKAAAGEKMLVLIDEPARNTNPEEGEAIVNALVGLLNDRDCFSLITTHYGNIRSMCRRLKVRGLREIVAEGQHVRPGMLQRWMDYSLLPADGLPPAHEACRIARLLGIDDTFATAIEKNITK